MSKPYHNEAIRSKLPTRLTRTLHRPETFMIKAVPDGVTQALTCPLSPYRYADAKTPRFAMRCLLQGEAVVHLPRTSNPPSLVELWRAQNLLTVHRDFRLACIALP